MDVWMLAPVCTDKSKEMPKKFFKCIYVQRFLSLANEFFTMPVCMR